MPVDRARRDAAAAALASFLRGEVDRAALEAVFKRLYQSVDAKGRAGSEGDAYLEDFLVSWLFLDDRYKTMTEEIWLHKCRHLAFLKTDYEKGRYHPLDYEDADRPQEILRARWHTLGLLIVFGVAYLTTWWLCAAATVVSYVLYQVSLWRLNSVMDGERTKEQKRRLEYYPFADQGDWLAHKHIVEEYRLPAFDTVAFGDPLPVREWPAFVAIPVRWACYFVFAAVLSYMVLFSVIFWPVWLMMVSISRREHPPPNPGAR